MTTERQTPAAKQVMTKCKQCDANELAAHEEMAMPPIWHQYIHVKNIIHRDLKPSNVLLTIEDTVKLTDFGLSRQHNAESRVQTVLRYALLHVAGAHFGGAVRICPFRLRCSNSIASTPNCNSASPPQQQQHYQQLPFLANHHNQQKQQHQDETGTRPVSRHRSTRCTLSTTSRTFEIGSSAFASVFHGFEPPNNRNVALKRINLTEIDMDSVLYASVLNEGVKYLVLVLEYVNGGDLETWLKVCCSTILEEKYGGDTPAGDISAELELFVDDDVSSADVAAVQPTALDNWPPSTRQQQLHKRLSSVDLPFPPPSPQFHRFHPQLQSPVSASPPQQQQHYQRLPFLANHHNQQKQQQQVGHYRDEQWRSCGQQDNSSSGANATSSLI
uniref:Protein kinase domain-containing protein n=1 Tax=Globodera pallida TaxID=36090 RepID=A0A183CPR2_GLOPA